LLPPGRLQHIRSWQFLSDNLPYRLPDGLNKPSQEIYVKKRYGNEPFGGHSERLPSSKTKYQTGLGLSSNFFTKLLPALQKKLAQNSIPGNIQTADGNVCKCRRRCGLSQALYTTRCSGYNIVKLPA